MKKGDLVASKGLGVVGVYEGAPDWALHLVLFDPPNHGRFVEKDDIRPLTPEERAAYALGWRGPVAQEPAS